MEFFAAVVKAESAWNTKGRNVIITLAKTDKEAEYWPRLTKDKVKNSRITVDWAKWVDEDEEDDAGNAEMDGAFDPAMMNAFGGGGMPGMPGMHGHGHGHGHDHGHDHGHGMGGMDMS